MPAPDTGPTRDDLAAQVDALLLAMKEIEAVPAYARAKYAGNIYLKAVREMVGIAKLAQITPADLLATRDAQTAAEAREDALEEAARWHDNKVVEIVQEEGSQEPDEAGKR